MKLEARSQEPEVRMEISRLAPAKSFEQLIVWQKAHQFVLDVYRLSDNFPRTEIYGLTSQLRRAAISIPANIAEGFKKRGTRRQGSFSEHRPRLTGRMSLLFDSGKGFELRRHQQTSTNTRRDQ
jgi:hypothetical protein